MWETADATYDFVVGVNLLGLFHSIKTFVPRLVEQGGAADLAKVAPAVRMALLNPGMVKTNLMRTSAARLPEDGSIAADLVDGMHDALNQAGVEPDVAVSWAMDALDEGRFWALPVADDPFAAMLEAELAELGNTSST